MATPTRIVVYFDDGTQTEISVRGMSSVFFNQAAAVKCGRRPPYKQGPPPNGGSGDGEMTLMATEDDGQNGDGNGDGDSCYYVNGMIVCP